MGFADALSTLSGNDSPPPDTATDNGVSSASGRPRIWVTKDSAPSENAKPTSWADTLGTLKGESAPAPNQPTQQPQKVGTLDAAITGVLQGVTGNFFDEMQGAKAASGVPDFLGGAFQIPVGAARLAYEHATGQPGEASKAYDEAVAKVREYQTQAQDQHPIANAVGNVGGALMLPVGGAAAATTMPGRIAAGAGLGAGYGAVYGAGEGTSLGDRATRAGTGAALGGVAGAAAPPILAGIGAASRAVGSGVGKVLGHPIQTGKGLLDPDREAARRIGTNILADYHAGKPGMSATDLAAARSSGQPTSVIDVGGENTRALGRSAANTSPAGRAALDDMATERFAGQSQRVENFVRDLVPTPGNATRTAEAIDAAERTANRGAYARAYAAGNRTITSPELERLAGSPDVTAAMKEAAVKGKSRAIADGLTAPTPGVQNIQFWDSTYRSLRDSAQAAFRAGRNDEGSYLSSLSKQMRSELDKQVPEYGKARGVASEFFQAENALEAGQKFVSMRGPIEEARIAHAKMTPPQKALFAEGFVSDLADKVSKISDNRSVTIDRIFNSPDGRARVELALGKGRAQELEYFLRRENMMDLVRKSLGNSTTARQLMEMGIAGGVGAAAGGAAEAALGGKFPDAKTAMSALFVGAAAGLSRKVNFKVAQRVGEMLASDDPKVLMTALKMAKTNPDAGNVMRRAETMIEKIAGQHSNAAAPMLPNLATGRADEQQQQ